MATAVIPAVNTSQLRRTLETTIVVAIWIALGVSLHLEVRTYLLLGIPITAAFQWGVRREPLHTVWVRDAERFHLDSEGWVIALLLSVVPIFQLASDLRSKSPVTHLLFDLAAAGGAVAVAYGLRNMRGVSLKSLLYCLLIAGGLGIAIMVASGFQAGFAHRALMQRLGIGIGSLLMYIPISFTLEEVTFRGAFDAHVHHPGDSHGWLSAIFVSALWGLWHLPVVLGQAPLSAVVPQLLAVHCVIGVPLSIYWRRSGNLFVTGSTHALVDAVRNALLVLPWH